MCLLLTGSIASPLWFLPLTSCHLLSFSIESIYNYCQYCLRSSYGTYFLYSMHKFLNILGRFPNLTVMRRMPNRLFMCIIISCIVRTEQLGRRVNFHGKVSSQMEHYNGKMTDLHLTIQQAFVQQAFISVLFLLLFSPYYWRI